MELTIARGGTIHCVYGEAIDLNVLGRVSIRRASHVEPDDTGHWFADLSPVAGPRIGPFDRRSEALAAELAWLNAHWRGRTQGLAGGD